MTLQEFKATLKDDVPPTDLSAYLIALWYEQRGNWNRAHEIVQEVESSTAAWVHAYLHRREGDEWNSRYWYRQSGRPFPTGISLDEEWERMVADLLGPPASCRP